MRLLVHAHVESRDLEWLYERSLLYLLSRDVVEHLGPRTDHIRISSNLEYLSSTGASISLWCWLCEQSGLGSILVMHSAHIGLLINTALEIRKSKVFFIQLTRYESRARMPSTFASWLIKDGHCVIHKLFIGCRFLRARNVDLVENDTGNRGDKRQGSSTSFAKSPSNLSIYIKKAQMLTTTSDMV